MSRAMPYKTWTSGHWLEMIFGFLPALIYFFWSIWDFYESASNKQFSVFLISMVVLGIFGAYALMSSIWYRYQIRHKIIYMFMLSGILIESLYFVAILVLDTQLGNFETFYILYFTIAFFNQYFYYSEYLLANSRKVKTSNYRIIKIIF